MPAFLSLFGRSKALQAFDAALREAGLHPQALDEAVRLTMLRLLDLGRGATPDPSALRPAADLLAYCVLGPDDFADKRGAAAAGEQERRLDAAGETPEGLDARIVLLTLGTGIAHPAVAETLDWEMTDED